MAGIRIKPMVNLIKAEDLRGGANAGLAGLSGIAHRWSATPDPPRGRIAALNPMGDLIRLTKRRG